VKKCQFEIAWIHSHAKLDTLYTSLSVSTRPTQCSVHPHHNLLLIDCKQYATRIVSNIHEKNSRGGGDYSQTTAKSVLNLWKCQQEPCCNVNSVSTRPVQCSVHPHHDLLLIDCKQYATRIVSNMPREKQRRRRRLFTNHSKGHTEVVETPCCNVH
jgi:hypothetical protein